MRSLSTVSLAEILPANLVADPFVAALVPVFDEEFRLLVSDTEKISLLEDLASQPDAVLDELAWQLRVDLYDQSMDSSAKVALIASAIYWHSVKGTPHAVQRMIDIVFGLGSVVEWFDYAGAAFHFKVQVAGGQFPDAAKFANFVRLAGLVKRASAILESVDVEQSGQQAMYIGVAMHIGDHITLGSA
jgi:phage tail P2-like protein